MYNLINNVFNIWDNLENAYSKMAEPKGVSRSDFFKGLVGFSDGKHNLPSLLNKLNKDFNTTNNGNDNDDVLDKYTKLTDLFKVLGNYLDNNSIPNSIDNLDLYLKDCFMSSKGNSTTIGDFLNEFNYNESNNVNYFYYKVMLEEFDCLVEHIECDKSGKLKTYVGVENPKDEFKYFTKFDAYPFLKECYSKRDYMENKFNLDCATIIALLAKAEKLPNMFCISSYKNLKDNMLFGKREIMYVGEHQDNSIKASLLEFKHKEMSIFCLY